MAHLPSPRQPSPHRLAQILGTALAWAAVMALAACGSAGGRPSADQEATRLPATVLWGGPDPSPPAKASLEQRIRALASGDQIEVNVVQIDAPASFQRAFKLPASGSWSLLSSAEMTALMAGVATDPSAQALTQPQITVFPLQRAHAAFVHQNAYLADYEVSEGRPDPIIDVNRFGQAIDVQAEVLPDGTVTLDRIRAHSSLLMGMERTEALMTVDGADRWYPFEEPTVLACATVSVPASARLRPGQVLALSMTARVERHTAHVRALARSLRPDPSGSRSPVPGRSAESADATPRATIAGALPVVLISAEVEHRGPPERIFRGSGRGVEMARLELPVTVHADHAPLRDVVQRIADSTGVRIVLPSSPDADTDATRVTIHADQGKLRDVLGTLLPQTLLAAHVHLEGIELRAIAGDHPAPALMVSARRAPITDHATASDFAPAAVMPGDH